MSNAELVSLLIERGLTIAVAESLTGGHLVSSLIDVPGASATVLGGVVAYNSALKHRVLGVSADLLESNGAVDPDVARQMAIGVRVALSVNGRPADVGLATTGVAGPEPQDGKPVGMVFVGVSLGEWVDVVPLQLAGTRSEIRSSTVQHALAVLLAALSE